MTIDDELEEIAKRCWREAAKSDAPQHTLACFLAAVEEAQRLALPSLEGTTHSESCWKDRGHHACAIERVEEAQKECFALAATQCESPSAGERGDMVCLKLAAAHVDVERWLLRIYLAWARNGHEETETFDEVIDSVNDALGNLGHLTTEHMQRAYAAIRAQRESEGKG